MSPCISGHRSRPRNRGARPAAPARPAEARQHMKHASLRAAGGQGFGARRPEAVHQRRHRQTEQRLHIQPPQCRAGQAQQFKRTAVGAHHAALGRHRQNAFHQRADEVGAVVEVDAQRVAVVVAQPVVLDHARRQLHQRHRVRVVAAVVPGHVQHAQHVAARVDDGRGRAGEEVVGVHVVLVGMHKRGKLLDQRGADGVGALGGLGPVHARLQRHLGGARQEVVVADRMDDGAGRVAQHHHALRALDLAEQHLHHRCGMGVQPVVALAHLQQLGPAQRRVVGPFDARQAQRHAALVRLADGAGMLIGQRQRGAGRALAWRHRPSVPDWSSATALPQPVRSVNPAARSRLPRPPAAAPAPARARGSRSARPSARPGC